MRNSTKAKLGQVMFIITTVIIILITISSLVCFVVFDKTSARVLSVDRGIDDTIVYFGYEVDE